MSALLDTHAAIWYVFIHKRLSGEALKFIRRSVDRGNPVYISAISIVETIYLVEKGSIPLDALKKVARSHQRSDVQLSG